ncbi:hypothetical protein SEVIR_1G149866v4 [Setaria viridis]
MEAKRCDLDPKNPPRISRNACISIGGKVPYGKIAYFKFIILSSEDEAPKKKKEAVVAPTRCSARLLGIKRKSYVGKTPEYTPANYGHDSDREDDKNPGSWGAASRGFEEDDNTYWDWAKNNKERKEQDGHRQDKGREKDLEDGEPELEEHQHACCPACRQNI